MAKLTDKQREFLDNPFVAGFHARASGPSMK